MGRPAGRGNAAGPIQQVMFKGRPIPVLLTLMLAVVLTARAAAPENPADQPGRPERPSGAQRTVRVFDFEESEYNPLPIPLGWVRAQDDPAAGRERPGFPIWNRALLDTESSATSGMGSVRLSVEGGSASVRLLPGVIGVFPGADYRVVANVRTERMSHARAAVAARLLDENGEPLPSTEAVSEPLRTLGEWASVAVTVPGLDERAAYLQIELLVLQPEQLPGRALDRPFAVREQDFHATAWFDDAVVTLLPRLEMDTGCVGQVIPASRTPEISVLVSDLTGQDLKATLSVLDADGLVVDTQQVQPVAGRLVQTLTPRLPGPGWYRAALRVDAAGAPVDRAELDFAWGAAEDEGARSASFSLRVSAVPPDHAAALAPVVDWSGVGHATVGVWAERLDRESVQPGVNPAFDAARALLDSGVEVTIGLDEAPGDLARLTGRDPADVLGVLGRDETAWTPWIARALDRLGQGVTSWQVGDEPFGPDGTALGAMIDAAADAIARWIPSPEVRAAWTIADQTPPTMVRAGRGLVIADDGAGADTSIAALVESWAAMETKTGSGADRPSLTIEFTPSSRDRATREGLGKLARRVVEAWTAARRVGVGDRVLLCLRDPWRPRAARRPAVMPTPELAVWRTLSSVLGDETVAHELDLLPGVRAVLTGSDDQGVLIAWLTDPDAPVRTLELPLSSGPVWSVDLLGGRRVIPLTEDSEIGMAWHRVPLSREPVFIEGVRVDLVRLLASVRLTPDRIDARLGERGHELVVHNPWTLPVRGKVFIVEPGGMSRGIAGKDRSWRVVPRVVPFSIDAGMTHRAPVQIAFGAAQESGWVPVIMDVQLFADEEYPMLRVQRRMAIDSTDLGIELVAVRTGAGLVSVDALVTNRSDRARSVELAAVAPGASRERATINGLSPGESATRRFLLAGVSPGGRVSVGLTEPETGARILRSIQAP